MVQNRLDLLRFKVSLPPTEAPPDGREGSPETIPGLLPHIPQTLLPCPIDPHHTQAAIADPSVLGSNLLISILIQCRILVGKKTSVPILDTCVLPSMNALRRWRIHCCRFVYDDCKVLVKGLITGGLILVS